MTLTVTGTTMTSGQAAHTARLAPGSQHLWEVSWLPGQTLDRNGRQQHDRETELPDLWAGQ